MSLLGTPFLVLVAVVTVLTPTAAALLWNRWPRPITWPARAVALLLVMVVGAASAAVVANRQFGFYSTFGDLGGASALSDPPAPFQPFLALGADHVDVQEPGWLRVGTSRARNGHGLLVRVRLAGRRSGIVRPGLVYLPPTWFLDRGISLPVVELLHGYPGSPRNYRLQLGIERVLDAEIAAHRMPPAVAVFPDTYDGGRASECVDAVNGQRDETYLAVDVPNEVQATFGTSTGRAWGLGGYSEGGFCAVNLGLHHPDRVAAAVSLSGYFTAGRDGTKRLYAGRPDVRRRNSPLWEVRHRAGTGPALLLVSGADDRASVEQDRALARAAHRYASDLSVDVALVPRGGHNFSTWVRALPAALDFLGLHLPAPRAPLRSLPPDRAALLPRGTVAGLPHTSPAPSARRP